MQTDKINSSKSGRQLLLQRALSHLLRWEANNSKIGERKALPQTSCPIHLMVSIAPTAISRRFLSPPQSPKHLLTLLSNSNDVISTSLKNIAVVARASLGGCMCLPVSAEKSLLVKRSTVVSSASSPSLGLSQRTSSVCRRLQESPLESSWGFFIADRFG